MFSRGLLLMAQDEAKGLGDFFGGSLVHVR
jgi:hypothetical protein